MKASRLRIVVITLLLLGSCRSSTRTGTTYSVTTTATYTTSLPGAVVSSPAPFVLLPADLLPPGLGFLTPTRLDARITGIVLRSTAGELTLGDFNEIHASPTLSSHLLLSDGGTVDTPYPMRLTLEQTYDALNYKFTAVLSPSGPTTRADAIVRGSPPSLQIEEGWGFFWGRRPRLMTRRVIAAAIGTNLAVELVDAQTHRVYIVGEGQVRVSCDDDEDGTPELGPLLVSNLLPLVGTGSRYVDVKFSPAGLCDSFDGPHDVTLGSSQATFLAEAQEIASKAGWVP